MKGNTYDNIIDDMFMSANLMKGIFMKIAQDNKEVSLLHSNKSILEVLIKKGPTPMTEIGKELCISKPNLTVIIDHLIQENLVKRSYDDKDRRIIKIDITEKGINSLKKSKEIIKEEFKKMLNQLNKKDAETLSSSLKDFKEIIEKINKGKKI